MAGERQCRINMGQSRGDWRLQQRHGTDDEHLQCVRADIKLLSVSGDFDSWHRRKQRRDSLGNNDAAKRCFRDASRRDIVLPRRRRGFAVLISMEFKRWYPDEWIGVFQRDDKHP